MYQCPISKRDAPKITSFFCSYFNTKVTPAIKTEQNSPFVLYVPQLTDSTQDLIINSMDGLKRIRTPTFIRDMETPGIKTTELLSFSPLQELTEDSGIEIGAPPNSVIVGIEKVRLFSLITINLWSISRRWTGPIRFAYFSSTFSFICRRESSGSPCLLNSFRGTVSSSGLPRSNLRALHATLVLLRSSNPTCITIKILWEGLGICISELEEIGAGLRSYETKLRCVNSW